MFTERDVYFALLQHEIGKPLHRGRLMNGCDIQILFPVLVFSYPSEIQPALIVRDKGNSGVAPIAYTRQVSHWYFRGIAGIGKKT
jgi:hypothetical protein